jgi:nucleoside-diphosphate-sugar epimerase
MVAALRFAVTGGTGFVGTRLLNAIGSAGHEVQALTRRPQAERDAVTWVQGSLEDREALGRLADGADALIHVAGVINADEAGFETGNVQGTAGVVDAAKKARVGRFVHVSSLAAREPGLSRYGASKARSEAVVRESGLDFAIVRPPAVYGPGDRETLELFRMARRGLILLPPEGRLSLLHADDLARLLIGLAENRSTPALVEPDDGRPGGWTHREFAFALSEAVGRNAFALSMPRAAVRLGALLDRLVRRDGAKLTPDRAAYFCHPDWVVDPALAPPADLWTPAVDTRAGLKATAEWYRTERLLRGS